MNRRKDTKLRAAISVIEAMLLSSPSTDDIIHNCLEQLTILLRGSFGYAYRCLDTMDETTQWQFCSSIEVNSEKPLTLENTSTSTVAPADIIDRLAAGRCVYYDTRVDALSPVPHIHPHIKNAFCIPLVDARNLFAVIYCCNVSGGLDAKSESRIRPFISASSCLLRAAQKKEKHVTINRTNNYGEDFNGQPSRLLDHTFQLIEAMFNGVLILDTKDRITLCNSAAASMIGVPRQEIIGQPLRRFLPRGGPQLNNRLIDPSNPKKAAEIMGAPPNASKVTWRGVPLIRANNDKALIDLKAFELALDGQILRGLVMDDISDRMSSMADYHNTLQRFQALTNLAPVAIIQLNQNWDCVYANDTWCKYTQMTPEEAHGTGWLEGLYSVDAEKSLLKLRDDAANTQGYSGQFRLQTPLGAVTWVKANASCLFNETGETSGIIMTLSDISAQLQNEKRLREIAEKDQLTGLVNRAFFNDRLDTALKGIDRFGNVVLMFCDLDEFKHINDNLGHDVGDALLQKVASRLTEAVRNVDTIARIGGDEFTIICTGVQNVRAMAALAEKIIESLNQAFIINDRSVYVTSSIGIAVAEIQDISSKSLLKHADIALYKAKSSGKNQYTFYKEEFEHDANLHVFLRESLRDPERNDFRVVYQPQVNAHTGEITGIEALTRWEREGIDPTSPEKIIRMIEDSGLATDFSHWLLHDIFTTISNWKKNSSVSIPKVSINLSAIQFRDKDLAVYLTRCTHAHGISPKEIVFEVTETALIDDPKLAARTLKQLGKLGFGLSLDDFGTGYSSLGYLRDMPFDSVKIDKSFVENVFHDESNAKIVLAIIGLADMLGLHVIAEGVENNDVKQWLIENNCPIQQGFLFHKPLELAALENLFNIGNLSNNILPFQSSKG